MVAILPLITTVASGLAASSTSSASSPASSASSSSSSMQLPPGTNMSTYAVQQMSVQSCSARMNGQLPSFVPTGFNYSGTSRQIYMKAEEVVWDYIPSGWDNMRGIPISDTPTSDGSDYSPSNNSLGHKYRKSLFRGYTSSNYTSRVEHPSWLGFQGPLIRAEVGDMVEVMVLNDLQSVPRPVSLHSMGLQYTPDSEGANYYRGSNPNGTAVSYKGDSIPTNDCFVYKWLVTVHSAPDPGPYAAPSKLWSYHGDQNLQFDVMSGLLGPVIVYNSGEMEKVRREFREFALFFATTDEYQSNYQNDNVATYAPNATFTATPGAPSPSPTSSANETIWGPIFEDLPATGSNATLLQSFMAISGYAFNSFPAKSLEMCLDDKIVWHFWSMGSFNDGYHSVHAHGHNMQDNTGAYSAQVTLVPASMKSVTMQAINPGRWQLLCHVAAHWQMGMEVLYNVAQKGVGMC